MLFFNHIRQAISSPKEKISRISFFTLYIIMFLSRVCRVWQDVHRYCLSECKKLTVHYMHVLAMSIDNKKVSVAYIVLPNSNCWKEF